MFNLNGAETVSTPEMPKVALPLVMVGLVALAVAVVLVKRRQS